MTEVAFASRPYAETIQVNAPWGGVLCVLGFDVKKIICHQCDQKKIAKCL